MILQLLPQPLNSYNIISRTGIKRCILAKGVVCGILVSKLNTLMGSILGRINIWACFNNLLPLLEAL